VYDNTTPEQWIYGLVACLIAFGVMAWLFFRYTPPRDDAHNMSSTPAAPAAPVRSAKPVLDQSAPIGLHLQTSSTPVGGLERSGEARAPDMDAEQTTWDTPRISRYLTDDEFIIFLASQKLRNGKYRLSANDIVKTVKGDRTEVLAIVRQVREHAPAVFRPLDAPAG